MNLKTKLQEKSLNQILHSTNWIIDLPNNIDEKNVFFLLINNTKIYPSYLFNNNQIYPKMNIILSILESKNGVLHG